MNQAIHKNYFCNFLKTAHFLMYISSFKFAERYINWLNIKIDSQVAS